MGTATGSPVIVATYSTASVTGGSDAGDGLAAAPRGSLNGVTHLAFWYSRAMNRLLIRGYATCGVTVAKTGVSS